jgi:hypothetical protein
MRHMSFRFSFGQFWCTQARNRISFHSNLCSAMKSLPSVQSNRKSFVDHFRCEIVRETSPQLIHSSNTRSLRLARNFIKVDIFQPQFKLLVLQNLFTCLIECISPHLTWIRAHFNTLVLLVVDNKQSANPQQRT